MRFRSNLGRLADSKVITYQNLTTILETSFQSINKKENANLRDLKGSYPAFYPTISRDPRFQDILTTLQSSTTMNPTQAEIESMFGSLSKVPSGYVAFFDHVDDDVKWEITGQNSLSGTWLSKSVFMKEVWLPIIKLIADPGPILEIVSAETIMKAEDGWIAIELKTTNTRTKLGNRLYNQNYCWKCKFNAAKKIVNVRAFIDSSTAEAILADEKFRQEALDIVPSSGK